MGYMTGFCFMTLNKPFCINCIYEVHTCCIYTYSIQENTKICYNYVDICLYFEHHHDESPAFIPCDSAWYFRQICCHLTNCLLRAANQFGLEIATRNVLLCLTCYTETFVLQLYCLSSSLVLLLGYYKPVFNA
jgi:hypothetical protein